MSANLHSALNFVFLFQLFFSKMFFLKLVSLAPLVGLDADLN